MNAVDYRAPRVITEFMQSNARFRVLHGPFRSGKSVGSMIEIVRRAKEQKPDKKGLRRSRWAVIRNTMPQLRDTTMKTWFDWFPDGSCGWWKETGKTFHLEFGDVKAEVIFRALDDDSDVKNLLSLELTGAYINEAREIPKSIVEGLDGRIGQYPKMADGGCSWYGIWADTNPPEEGSYWWAMIEGLDPETGEMRPNDWKVFKQPGGMKIVSAHEPCDWVMRDGTRLATNPDADNLSNLIPGYYSNLVRDKTDEYIKVYVLGKYGVSKAGKPVHPTFKEELHVARDILIPNPHLTLVLAADFGRTPAIIFKQQDVFGRVLHFDEVVTTDMGLERALNERVKPLIRNKYADFKVQVTGDPAGNSKSQNDENSCVTIFKKCGFSKVKFAYSNNPIHRTGATDHYLSRMSEQGPSYLVSPNCSHFIRGMKGGYHYKINKSGITSEEPEKNIFSHICEAGQYGDMWFLKGSESHDRDEERKRVLTQLARESAGIYSRRP